MKCSLATFAALALVSPAFGASVIIDGTHGARVLIGTFGPEIDFTSTLLSGSPTNFTASVYGLTTADGRWCSGFPPGEEPPDCDAPIDPIWSSGTFTASWPWPEFQELVVPFFGQAIDGYLSFEPTDGGRVRIDVDGTAVPEPASWMMMLGGFGLVGGMMRARRGRRAVSFG
jgi:hypothetical protein